MLYDLSTLALPLALAVLLGSVVGWQSFSSSPQQNGFVGWFRVAAVIWAVGSLLAVFRLLPWEAGFWLESLLLLFVAFVIGGFVGGIVRGFVAPPAAGEGAWERPLSEQVKVVAANAAPAPSISPVVALRLGAAPAPAPAAPVKAASPAPVVSSPAPAPVAPVKASAPAPVVTAPAPAPVAPVRAASPAPVVSPPAPAPAAPVRATSPAPADEPNSSGGARKGRSGGKGKKSR